MAKELNTTSSEVEALRGKVRDQNEEIKSLGSQLALEQEKCAALEAEVQRLSAQVTELLGETEALRKQLEKALAAKAKANTGSSVVFDVAPRTDAPLDRPTVEVNGTRYQFARGRIGLWGKTYLATELAADSTLVERILLEYPQLLVPVDTASE